MRVVVLLALGLAVLAVAMSLQALASLAHRLPQEPRAGRSRSVLQTSRHAPPESRHGRRGPSGRPTSRVPGRSTGGSDELEQLEILAERALAGEATATARLAQRAEAAAAACGLPHEAVPAAAHHSLEELWRALEGLERGLPPR